MKRRDFNQAALAAPFVAQATLVQAAGSPNSALLNAYYLRAHMYTSVPRQVREDLRWMADIGTSIVSIAVLEHELVTAVKNIDTICDEAAKAGLQVYAIPACWGALTAAGGVPSVFTAKNPQTWMLKQDGSPIQGLTGPVSSIHYPETFQFFCESLDALCKQFDIKGVIWDEPKGFRVDHSPRAVAALGKNAPEVEHFKATTDFHSRVNRYIKGRYPDKTICLFTQPHFPRAFSEAASRVALLDYFGADGRPWDLEEDAKWKGFGEGNESGKGKVLLGNGERLLELARQQGIKTLFLVENHNLPAVMLPALDAGLPKVLAKNVDMLVYYYYPRNIEEPERNMSIVAKHIGARFRKR